MRGQVPDEPVQREWSPHGQRADLLLHGQERGGGVGEAGRVPGEEEGEESVWGRCGGERGGVRLRGPGVLCPGQGQLCPAWAQEGGAPVHLHEEEGEAERLLHVRPLPVCPRETVPAST